MAKEKDSQQSQDILSELSFCVFDLETTGGNQKSDKIIEIGLVKIENLQIVDKKNYLIQPEIQIPDFIQKLTTITPQDVLEAPTIEDVIDEILEFMGDSILVAHNISFDIPFFNSVLKRLGRNPLKNRSICTNLMTKYLIPNLLNSNLNYMSKIFSIKHKKAHRALDDALATAQLLLTYLNIFLHKGIKKVNHLYYPRKRYELDQLHFKQGNNNHNVFSLIEQIKMPFLVTVKGENGVILYALPCSAKNSEKSFLKEKISSLKWETITVKLVGPFIEGLIQFSLLFNKLDNDIKWDTLNFLWQEHLGKKRPNHRPEGHLNDSILDREFGDFFIAHHLVPEQMMVYPLLSLAPKGGLVFRYPGHRKKLLQFINSKSARIESNKLRTATLPPQLKEFIDLYLKKCKESNELFIFKKSLPKKRPQEFIAELENFLADNQNPYNYPRQYI